MNIQLLFKKYGGKILLWSITLVLGVWLQVLLTPFFTDLNNYLTTKIQIPFTNIALFILNILNLTISIYSILLSIILLIVISTIYKAILLKKQKFKILKADYGSGKTFVDIKNQLSNFIVDNRIDIPLSNSVAGIDPTPGTVKVVNIKYKLNKKVKEKKYVEGDLIKLP